MIQSALKILCRQCSEFACANIISSMSLGSRSSRVKFVGEVVDLVVRQREAETLVRFDQRRATARTQRHVRNGRGASCENNCAASSSEKIAASVMRSYSAGAIARSCSGATAAGAHFVRNTALDALDRIETANVRDVGGFARPGRDGARPRNDDDRMLGVRRGAAPSGARGP